MGDEQRSVNVFLVPRAYRTMPMSEEHNEFARKLEKDNKYRLFKAVVRSDIDAVKMYLEDGDNINMIDTDFNPKGTMSGTYYSTQKFMMGHSGRTPLHVVHDDQVAKVLLDAGADMTIEDKEGKKPQETSLLGSKLTELKPAF